MKRLAILVLCAILFVVGVAVAIKTEVSQSEVEKFLDDLTLVCKGTAAVNLTGDIVCLELLKGDRAYVASLIKTPQDMELFAETLVDRCKTSSAEVCKGRR